jgi:hypothetical protein
MDANETPIHLAGHPLGQHRHVCAFFTSQDEEYRVLLPFIKEGLERGEKAFHIIDHRLRDDHLRRLGQAAIDVDPAIERGQLEIREWARAHLRGGQFKQHEMLSLVDDVLTGAQAQGYQLTRWVAHMEWSLEDAPGVEDIVEYETRLNHLLPRFRDVVI